MATHDARFHPLPDLPSTATGTLRLVSAYRDHAAAPWYLLDPAEQICVFCALPAHLDAQAACVTAGGAHVLAPRGLAIARHPLDLAQVVETRQVEQRQLQQGALMAPSTPTGTRWSHPCGPHTARQHRHRAARRAHAASLQCWLARSARGALALTQEPEHDIASLPRREQQPQRDRCRPDDLVYRRGRLPCLGREPRAARESRHRPPAGVAKPPYLQEAPAICNTPVRGIGGERNKRHGQSAAALVPSLYAPWRGGSVRQGAAAVRARCRIHRGSVFEASECVAREKGTGNGRKKTAQQRLSLTRSSRGFQLALSHGHAQRYPTQTRRPCSLPSRCMLVDGRCLSHAEAARARLSPSRSAMLMLPGSS